MPDRRRTGRAAARGRAAGAPRRGQTGRDGPGLRTRATRPRDSPPHSVRHGLWFSRIPAAPLVAAVSPGGIRDRTAGPYAGRAKRPRQIGHGPFAGPARIDVIMWLSEVPARVLPTALSVVVFSGAVAADVSRSRADADAMLRKVAVIADARAASQPQPRRTTVTESELNSFLGTTCGTRSRQRDRAGVTIEEAGRLRGRALVDLDEVKKANAGDPVWACWLWRPGACRSRPGHVAGHRWRRAVQAREGPRERRARANAVLQQVVSYYSRTPENPKGIDLEAPFALPVNIRADRDAPGTSRHRAMIAHGSPPGRRCPDVMPSPMRCSDAAAVPEGCGAAEGGRFCAGRTAHGRRPALPLSAPLRGSQPR